MSERLRPPQKEQPKTEKGKTAKSGKDAEIAKAKEVIEAVTSKDESVRLKAIESLRNPPLENLAEAKKALTSFEKIDWLLKSADEVQYSPEVALFASRIASAGELADDPHWLMAKTVELAYSARPDATAESRREISAAIGKVGARLEELRSKSPDAFKDMKPASFDEAIYGSPMGTTLLPAEKNVFKEDKPEEETITDPELIRILREINKKIRTNPEYLDNPQYLESDIYELQKKAGDRGVPENQMVEAITRLKEIRNAALKSAEARAVERNRHYPEVSWDEMSKTMLEEDQVPHDFQKKFEFHYLSPAEINQLRLGEEGQQEFFYEFVSKIYSMGRTPERAELPDLSKYEEFTRFMTWLYPERTDYHLGKYEYMWKEMPKHYQIVKNLLFTPGDIKDKLKNLQFMTPADMDHYIKNINHANYALSLYEDAVFDVLSERQVKYKEALTYLKGNPNAIQEYKNLVGERQKGRLSPEKELRFQQLQEQVDLVGYGVNLWDVDVQNYTELDLEVNEMSKELDRLRLKQSNWEQKKEGAEKLTEWEEERFKTLKDEIIYKQNVAQNAKKIDEGYGMELKKSQHDNRGLSPIDIEVKDRLRILLQDRFPERQIKEWELNRAVWAARQWMIGSSRIVSISSGMAIRPNAEFDKLVKEVNGGKYVMRAPAFEDLQRVINPELFEARFGMGDQMGEVFRSFTDWDLLESKGYKFENKSDYRKDDEVHLDPMLRRTREFIRQVEDQSGIPYSEMITQGFFQGGGNFDKTGWRAEMATVDEIRKKYLDMQKRGDLKEGDLIDNQALGIQLLLKGGKEGEPGRKELLLRLVRRNPTKLFHLLGEPVESLYRKYNLTDAERKSFRRALSIVKVDAWDRTGQRGDKKKLVFRDINILTNEGDFNTLLRPYLVKEGFSDGRITDLSSLLKEADKAFEKKAGTLAAHDFPITITTTDVDWKDASMFQTGTTALDRRARDMGAMAAARDAWIAMHKPEFLANKDIKETLGKLKEFRDSMNNYTTGGAAENATYELARAWLKFNRNRMIYYENREGGLLGAVRGRLRTVTGWIPFYHTIQKNLGEVDVSRNVFAKRKIPFINKEFQLFGDQGEKISEAIERLPHKLAQDVSYAVRYTGAHGNAFEEKQIDEALDQMLQMGIFNSNESLYHKLRREMHSGLGNQIVGVVRKYWWLLPLLTAAYGAKEGIEEEKKR